MGKRKLSAVIVGGGHRSFTYANYALLHPDELQIVGIADPNKERREKAATLFGFSQDRCYESASELAKVPKFADFVINGTMDHQHVRTAVPLLDAGYDMLLEKPFSVNIEEMHELLDAVHRNNSKVMICHVLRYSPFYLGIKKRILAGDIGDIINIRTAENVSYHHLSTSYVRGKWSNSDRCKTSMLLAKCCHDIDIMMWLMQPVLPKSVSSCGGIFQFKPENAPEGAGTKCLVDCPLVNTCIFSAKKLYIEHPERWSFYVWDALESIENPTIEDKINLLKGESPYGRCIYKCDNNVVDHQSVLVEFENGATGSHNMTGGSSKSQRDIHIVGTLGEIYGVFDENRFTVSRIVTENEDGCEETVYDCSSGSDGGHGGGDLGLIADLLDYLRDGTVSDSCTAIENSVAGHLTVFLADSSLAKAGMPQTFDFSQF